MVFLVKSEKPCIDKTSSTEIQKVQPVPAAEASGANSSSGSRLEEVFSSALHDEKPHLTALSEGVP